MTLGPKAANIDQDIKQEVGEFQVGLLRPVHRDIETSHSDILLGQQGELKARNQELLLPKHSASYISLWTPPEPLIHHPWQGNHDLNLSRGEMSNKE